MNADDNRSCPSCRLTGALAGVVLTTACGAAFAARPLSVDDTGTNEAGAGHVEGWFSRAAGSNTFSVSPALGIVDGFELVGALSRDQSTHARSTTIQFRWTLTEAKDTGCNAGTSGGMTRVSDGGARQYFAYGMVTCNFSSIGTTHSNLGLIDVSGESSVITWGVAFERTIGPVTPHIEYFGARGSKPTLQLGARSQILDRVQLDGTVGRSDGETLFSLGFRVQF